MLAEVINSISRGREHDLRFCHSVSIWQSVDKEKMTKNAGIPERDSQDLIRRSRSIADCGDEKAMIANSGGMKMTEGRILSIESIGVVGSRASEGSSTNNIIRIKI